MPTPTTALDTRDGAPGPFPGYGDEAGLDLALSHGDVARQVTKRLLSDRFKDWSAAASRVGFCARPVHLVGSSTTVDTATGEVLSTYSSDSEPLGTTLTRCGNRRASVCPSCSRVYAADMFHLIRAGVTGGKGVPASVGENPLVFATLTAPSFGRVHGSRGGRPCRPNVGTPRTCPHGRPTACRVVHDDEDPLLGQPLCRDCYDYDSHVVWQWWAPELWRRATITLKRLLAAKVGVPESRLSDVVTVQYAKVAEYQRRGVIHFHALVRVDGPATDDGFAPAPDWLTAATVADLVEQATRAVRYTAPPVFDGDPARVLAFGAQVDTRPVRLGRRTDDPDQGLTAEQVAGYLAKYSTKSATDTIDATGNPHLRRVQAVAHGLARKTERQWAGTASHEVPLREWPYGLLRKWAPAFGFRGHFATKSRRYSVTLGVLRRARRRAQAFIADAQRAGRTVDLAALEADLLADDTDETTLVIGSWAYAGTGWGNDGDTELARAAAARAREYAQHRAEVKRRQSETSGRRG